MPEKYERVARQLKDKDRRQKIGFMDPKAEGERLGIFEHVSFEVDKEPHPPTFAEVLERSNFWLGEHCCCCCCYCCCGFCCPSCHRL